MTNWLPAQVLLSMSIIGVIVFYILLSPVLGFLPTAVIVMLIPMLILRVNPLLAIAVAVVMADASDSPEDLIAYWRLLNDGYDCAFGSRFMAGSVVLTIPVVLLFFAAERLHDANSRDRLLEHAGEIGHALLRARGEWATQVDGYVHARSV